MALVEHEQGHYVNNVKFQFFIYSYLPKLKNINTLSTKTKKINIISNNEKVLTEKTCTLWENVADVATIAMIQNTFTLRIVI